MSELLNFETIYTIGSYRVNQISDVQSKDGLYIAHVGEQLGYRYQVEKTFGAGAFG